MNRAKIDDVLLAMGVPAGIKGFECVADAVEYIEKHGTDISVTKELYPEIAKKRNTTASRVERAIRHAFEVARSCKGNYEVVEKYIGFINCTNFSSIVMMHKRIKEECDSEQKVDKKIFAKNEKPIITASEIRDIFRQELKKLLSDWEKMNV